MALNELSKNAFNLRLGAPFRHLNAKVLYSHKFIQHSRTLQHSTNRAGTDMGGCWSVWVAVGECEAVLARTLVLVQFTTGTPEAGIAGLGLWGTGITL
jgi:hypothetical protein